MTRVELNNQAAELQRETEAQQAHRVHEREMRATLHHGTSFAYGGNSPHARMMRSQRLRRLQQLARLRAMLFKRLGRGEGASEGAEGEGAAAHETSDRVMRRRDGGQGGRHGNSGGDGKGGGTPKRLNVKVVTPADRYKVSRRQDRHQGGSGQGGSGGDHSGGGNGGNGGGGPGGGSGGESGKDGGKDSGRDGRPAQPLDAVARGCNGKASPITGKLGEAAVHAETAGEEARHPDAFGAAWADDALDLLDELARSPMMPLDARALDLNIAWLALQKRFGRQTSGGIAMFAERAAERKAARPAATSTTQTPRRPTSQHASAHTQDANVPTSPARDRLRDMRFLAPLMSLNGEHPRPLAWVDSALARLDGMRAFAAGRHAQPDAPEAPREGHSVGAIHARNDAGKHT